MPDTLYTTTATAWGGREGRTATDDGKVDLQLSRPKGMGGDDGPGTNPEQLFAAGYAACFHSAMMFQARQRRLDVTGSAVSATVSLTGSRQTGLDLAVRIEASIPGLDRDAAQDLLQATVAMCPYARATKGNISSEYVLVDDEA